MANKKPVYKPKHVDFNFELGDNEQLMILSKICEEKFQGNPAFKVHLATIPSLRVEELRMYYSGRVRIEKPEEPIPRPKNGFRKNNIGLRVLDATEENRYDRTDRRHWNHLRIVITKEGKTPAGNKIRKQKMRQVKVKNEETGEVTKIWQEFYYWIERMPKKILLVLDGILPNIQVVNRYDRVWTNNPDHLEKIPHLCRHCGNKMTWKEDHSTLECVDCKNTEDHPKFFLIEKNGSNLDFWKEYHKVMG